MSILSDELQKSLDSAFLAARTDRVRLGTHVYNIGLRHPFVSARAVQTLDIISGGRAEFGVALCGSGIGISIAANRHPACRCARVDEPLSAELARAHNDANVIAMGARLIGIEMAKACVTAFLATPFGGGRHARRVEKLSHPHFSKEPA